MRPGQKPAACNARKHASPQALLGRSCKHDVQNRQSTSAQNSVYAATVKDALDSDCQPSSYVQADLKYLQALADVSQQR